MMMACFDRSATRLMSDDQMAYFRNGELSSAIVCRCCTSKSSTCSCHTRHLLWALLWAQDICLSTYNRCSASRTAVPQLHGTEEVHKLNIYIYIIYI